MKRLFTFAVALLLVGMVLPGTWAADESGQTVVHWNASGCWINLKVHENVDLGTITGPDQVLEDASGNNVRVKTNCANGFVLEVQAADASTPAGFEGDLLADFQWKVAQAPGSPHVTNVQDAYTSFSDFNAAETVAVSSKPGTVTFGMGYRYTSDEQDIPGDYSITLLYTATSQ